MFLEKALLSLAEDGEERGGQAWGEGGREEGKEGTKAEGGKDGQCLEADDRQIESNRSDPPLSEIKPRPPCVKAPLLPPSLPPFLPTLAPT